MSDRTYLRTNFSSATAPTSAGAKKTNAAGEEYARIPLQLPSNLVDSAHMPRGVEMLLTKMSIPLGRVPIAQIPIDDISREIRPIGRTHILTSAWCTIWPFLKSRRGTILPSNRYNPFIFNPDYAEQNHLTHWPVVHMEVPIFEQINGAIMNEKIEMMKREKMAYFEYAEEITSFLTENFTEAYRRVMLNCAVDPSTAALHQELASGFDFEFKIENSRLKMVVRNRQYWDPVIPFTYSVFEDSFTEYDRIPAKLKLPLSVYTKNNSGLTRTPIIYEGYSFVGNKALADFLPGLPWVKIDSSLLADFDPNTGNGQKIWGWGDPALIPTGDKDFYLLDLTDVNFEWGPVEEYRWDETQSDPGNTEVFCSQPAIFHFDNLNLISMIPISSFVVMLNGVSFTPQTYPVNLISGNDATAQTTTVPIIEVYYPLWTSIEDLTTNLIVSKDAFTNAAPFMLGPEALFERNLTFEIYYVTTNGTLHLLTIPPNTAVTIQVCYSISYY